MGLVGMSSKWMRFMDFLLRLLCRQTDRKLVNRPETHSLSTDLNTLLSTDLKHTLVNRPETLSCPQTWNTLLFTDLKHTLVNRPETLSCPQTWNTLVHRPETHSCQQTWTTLLSTDPKDTLVNRTETHSCQQNGNTLLSTGQKHTLFNRTETQLARETPQADRQYLEKITRTAIHFLLFGGAKLLWLKKQETSVTTQKERTSMEGAKRASVHLQWFLWLRRRTWAERRPPPGPPLAACPWWWRVGRREGWSRLLETCSGDTQAQEVSAVSDTFSQRRQHQKQQEKDRKSKKHSCECNSARKRSKHATLQALLSGTLPPNSAAIGYTTEGALLFSSHLFTKSPL